MVLNNLNDQVELRFGLFGKLLPLLVLVLGIVILFLTGWVHTRTLWFPPLAGFLVALIIAKNPEKCADAFLFGMTKKMVATVIMAWSLASIMGNLLQATGLVDGLVWLGFTFNVPGSIMPLVTLIVACLFATATGTSMGAIAAITPLMFPVGVGLGANPILMIGALVSGAFFGDNIAPISDTTIASATTQETDIPTVVKTRLKYAFVALGIAAVLYVIFGISTSQVVSDTAAPLAEVVPNGLIMLIVPIVLIVVMFRGFPIVPALMFSNAFGIVLGLITGLLMPAQVLFVDLSEGIFRGVIYSGINSMLPLIMFSILLLGLVGVFEKSGLFEDILTRISRTVKTAARTEFSIFVVTIIGNIITAGSARSIMAVGPIAKALSDKQNLAPHRAANILDAVAVGTIMFIPYNPVVMATYQLAIASGVITAAELPSIIHAMPYFFYGYLLVAVILFSIIVGWGREYKNND